MERVRFLANENFPKLSVELLRKEGYEVDYIAEGSPGISDAEVIGHANERGLMILTFDSDYGELIYRQGLVPQSGVMYFRLHQYRPEEPGQLIHALVESGGVVLDRCLYVVSHDGVKMRRY